MPYNNKVAHLTSVHPRTDTRIFLKQCKSLAKLGFDVNLVVADGRGGQEIDGVTIHDVGASGGRLDRVINAPGRVFKKAVELDADLYHLHDPELLPIGLKLKRRGKRVIFDAHEDLTQQLKGKHYLNTVTKWILSNSFSVFEKYACPKLDAIVAATPFIRDKFNSLGAYSVDINNYPMISEWPSFSCDWSLKKSQVVYVGGLGRIRGLKEIVQAMSLAEQPSTLVVGGQFTQASFEEEVRRESGWSKVDYRGWLDRNGVQVALHESIAGLVTLHPIINYLDSLPVKMFEYMAAGLPVIASDFSLWRSIIESSNCGLCVDPLDPKAIAEAIDYYVSNPIIAEEMGANGRSAILQYYNWEAEELKLINLYGEVLNK